MVVSLIFWFYADDHEKMKRKRGSGSCRNSEILKYWILSAVVSSPTRHEHRPCAYYTDSSIPPGFTIVWRKKVISPGFTIVWRKKVIPPSFTIVWKKKLFHQVCNCLKNSYEPPPCEYFSDSSTQPCFTISAQNWRADPLLLQFISL